MRGLWISFGGCHATFSFSRHSYHSPNVCIMQGCWNLELAQWRHGESGCALKNARHLERVPRGCNVLQWPTGWLYPVLSFFYSLQTALVSFPTLNSNDFFIWHSHWRESEWGPSQATPALPCSYWPEKMMDEQQMLLSAQLHHSVSRDYRYSLEASQLFSQEVPGSI